MKIQNVFGGGTLEIPAEQMRLAKNLCDAFEAYADYMRTAGGESFHESELSASFVLAGYMMTRKNPAAN